MKIALKRDSSASMSWGGVRFSRGSVFRVSFLGTVHLEDLGQPTARKYQGSWPGFLLFFVLFGNYLYGNFRLNIFVQTDGNLVLTQFLNGLGKEDGPTFQHHILAVQ